MPIENPIFSKSFIDSLPDDNDEALYMICNQYYISLQGANDEMKVKKYYKVILKAYAFLKVILRTRGIGGLYNYEIICDPYTDINKIEKIFNKIGADAKKSVETKERKSLFDKYSEEYDSLIDSGLKFEFSESNLEEIQALINQLRDEIQKSHVLPEGHRVRLLRRLEKFQSELHKTMSNLDTFWSFFGDAGAVLGKFGKEVKPLVDQIREIAKIITSCLAASQGLPQGTILFLPEIPTNNDNKKDKKQKK